MTATGDIALGFLHAFWRGDVDAAGRFLAPDTLLRSSQSLSNGGAREKDAHEVIRWIVEVLFSRFEKAADGTPGITIDLRHVLADGAQVAVEYGATGRTVDGVDYANDYVMMLRVEDGLIRDIRPHTDTRYLIETLMPGDR